MMVAPFHFSEILMLMLMNGTILNTQMQIVHIKYRRAQSHKHSKCACVRVSSSFDFCLSPCIHIIRFLSTDSKISNAHLHLGCCICLQRTGNLSVCSSHFPKRYFRVRILNYERFRILIPHYTKNWNGCLLDSCSNTHTHTFHDGCLRKCIRN